MSRARWRSEPADTHSHDTMPVRPVLAITLGDPQGIGPEIVAKALTDARVLAACEPLLVGSPALLRRTAARLVLTLPEFRSDTSGAGSHEPAGDDELAGQNDESMFPPQPGPTSAGGALSFAWLERAIALAKAGRVQGIVTAPIAKDSWHMAGVRFPGHTEVLAERFDSPRSAMLFEGPSLRVVLATVHIALARVPTMLTRQRVLESICLAHEACLELGRSNAPPRIGVAAINPHAGEGGLFGDDDDRLVVPAISDARAMGIGADGPVPGDVVFLRAVLGRYDAVVAMYHDQGLIPVKLLDRERSINVTVGLRWNTRRVIRTSPAHGTAFDIAGARAALPTGDASPQSMIEAILLAARLAGQSV